MFKLDIIRDSALDLSPEEVFREEAYNYLTWLIRIRWAVAITVIIFSNLLLHKILFPDTSWIIILYVGFGLGLLNLLYLYQMKKLGKDKSIYRYYMILDAQIILDFVSIAILNYYLYPLTIIFIMAFVLHLAIGSVFLPKKKSMPIFILATIISSITFWISNQEVPFASFSLMLLKDALIIKNIIVNMGIIFIFYGIWYSGSEIRRNLKRREELLMENNKMLKVIEEEKSRLTVRATHELKAPFAAIKSYLLTMDGGYCGELPPKCKPIVKKMIKRCDRLSGNITDIIRLSNLKLSNYSKDKFKKVDIVPLVRKSIDNGNHIGEERNIRVIGELEMDEKYLNIISGDFEILIDNLIQNAIIYSYDNSTVTVQLKETEDHVAISVIDKGIGIKKEALPKIFNEYYRTNNAVEHNSSGNGLGLAIVKEIIINHKADITVDSELEKGSTFTVTFPA